MTYVIEGAPEPKSENMDGDSFLAWLWKVERDLRTRVDNIRIEDASWAVAAFNCNYDPRVAAYEWLVRAGNRGVTGEI